MFNWLKRESSKSSEATVRYSEWLIAGDDLARQYEIERDGQNTLFQMRCTLQLGSFGDLQEYVFFVLSPMRIRGDGFVAAHFCEQGKEAETAAMVLRSTEMDGGNLFGVTERTQADQCVRLFGLGQPLSFTLLDKGAVIAQLAVPNDGDFATTYKTLAERITAEGVKPGGLFS